MGWGRGPDVMLPGGSGHGNQTIEVRRLTLHRHSKPPPPPTPSSSSPTPLSAGCCRGTHPNEELRACQYGAMERDLEEEEEEKEGEGGIEEVIMYFR